MMHLGLMSLLLARSLNQRAWKIYLDANKVQTHYREVKR